MKRSQRKKKKSSWLRSGLMSCAMLAVSGGLVIAALNDVVTYYNLKMEIRANTSLLEQTREEQEKLETTKKNLTNPDYLEFVARGRYHVSKNGEQLFVFPALSQAENPGSLNSEAAGLQDFHTADSAQSSLDSAEPQQPEESEDTPADPEILEVQEAEAPEEN